LDTILAEIKFVLIAEALLVLTWNNISVLEKLWTASLVIGFVSILDSPIVLDTSIEISEFGSASLILLGEVNKTVTEAVTSVVGTSSWDFLWLWFTPALLFELWVRIILDSERCHSAIHPVIGLLCEMFPSSELIKGIESITSVVSISSTNIKSTFALA